ncbi:hypothetical protein KQX54_010305 [Cotesia glomerata]|uniref:RNase NYN domain-containing protein n=1 Tax=Cotesia glomerata TaxID=32391 RepID=A0AAV7IHB5_COTGL|nr:hypothetical protein KQX54_010305 [Cotesia glomerata]
MKAGSEARPTKASANPQRSHLKNISVPSCNLPQTSLASGNQPNVTQVESRNERQRQRSLKKKLSVITDASETISTSTQDDNIEDDNLRNDDQLTVEVTSEDLLLDKVFDDNVRRQKNNLLIKNCDVAIQVESEYLTPKLSSKIKADKQLSTLTGLSNFQILLAIENSKKFYQVQLEDIATRSQRKPLYPVHESCQSQNMCSSKTSQSLFFVDTKGDDSICEKITLLPKSEILYTANKFTKFDTAPTTSTTTSTTTNTNNTVTSEQAKSNTSDDQNNKQIHKLREIIVDGLNVAFGYSPGRKVFEKNGLQLVLDYFQDRGHEVKIFLPQIHRNRYRGFLEQWHRKGLVIFTPSRNIGGKKIVPYDDRFILDYATKCKGIVVSSDQYRDLWHEKPEWRETIEKRLLAPTFAGEYVMFPEDPLGRGGPSLNEFLKH